MDSMQEELFDANKKKQLLDLSFQISSGLKTLSDHCTEIRESVLHRDTETRRRSLNELAFVVINLPIGFLSGAEVKFLLDFFSARFADSGHAAELLVTVVHHLIFTQTSLDDSEIDALFHAIFDDNGVQAYVQSDREKLLDIFEFVTTKHFQVIDKMGTQFYTVFANSVGGERDPRCLLKVFSIFAYAMERIDLGLFMEEIFELVACYWPIEYSPKPSDTNPLTKEILSAACDACLLSNRGFSLYTYQLISEKLAEDEEGASGHGKKLEACKLLTRACQSFGSAELESFLNDCLAGLRMLCLNPKEVGAETMAVVGDTLKAMLSTIERDNPNAEKIIKEMADTMLENCEPFVVQPEMGLSTKALCLLEKMVLASKLVSNTVLPRVFYWIYVLITGSTVKNRANKDEIVEETLAIIPQWFSLASQINQLDTNQTNLLLATIRSMDEYPKFGRLKTLCECSTVLLNFGGEGLSDECIKNIEETLRFVVGNFDDSYEKELRLPIFNFVSSYSSKSPERCAELGDTLLTFPKWNRTQLLWSAGIMAGSEKLSNLLPVYLKHLTDSDSLSVTEEGAIILFLLFNSIRVGGQQKLYSEFLVPLLEFLLSCADQHIDIDRLKIFGSLLQDLGLLLDDEHHSELLKACIYHLTKAISDDPPADRAVSSVVLLSPICLQDQNAESHKQIVGGLKKINDEKLLPYTLAFCFAYYNRGGKRADIEIETAKLETLVAECRSKMLKSSNIPADELHEIFDRASPAILEQLLDFNTELTNPVKCRYKKTLMWAQRIITQFVPLFVKHYKETNNKNSMTVLIIPILLLVKKVSIPMVSELELLFPVLVESLHEANDSQDRLLVLLNATVQLLSLSATGAFLPDKLCQLAHVMEKILKDGGSNKAVYSALEVLELLGKRIKSRRHVFRMEQTLHAIRHAVQSKKRIIRQKAAHVYGTWDMLDR